MVNSCISASIRWNDGRFRTYVVSLQVGLDLGLCSVSVGQELLLVIQQLLPRLGGELGVLGWASELIIDSPGPFADPIRYRHDKVHLLRFLPRGLPRRRDC
jgi:hypothetical protein